MASKAITLLGLAALGGGVYYLASTRKKYPVNGQCPEGYHLMPDGTCMRDDDPSMSTYKPGPDAYSPPGWDALMGKYQAAIYGNASLGDCQELLGYFDSLEAETQAEADWIAARQTEVNQACSRNLAPAPTLPSVVSQWQDELNRCWAGDCSSTEVNTVIRALDNAASFYAGMIPNSDYETIRYASSALSAKQNQLSYGTYGTSGEQPHVGNCGCAQCQMNAQAVGDDDEPCCEACAMGTGACACSERNPFEENICQVPVTAGSA